MTSAVVTPSHHNPDSFRDVLVPNIEQLVDLFYSSLDQLGEITAISAEAVPEPYRHLLNHNHHMTVVVEEHFGELVDVQVRDIRETKTQYARKIALTRRSDQRVVQFGIVRLRLDVLPSSVVEQIRAKKVPLGRILIENDVMRRVTLTQLWQVRLGSDLQSLFLQDRTSEDMGRLTYGRTAMIHVDGEPAVELLEILAPMLGGEKAM